MTPQSLPWMEPLDAAGGINEPYWVLLYSGVRADYSGRYSYLACGLKERIEGNDFSVIEGRLSGRQPPFDNAWFGYLGYGLKDSLETLPHDRPGRLNLPNLCLMQFTTIYCFDHDTRTLTCWTEQDARTLVASTPTALYPPQVSELSSPMARSDYLAYAAEVIEAIHRGDLYQANLTRKFIGQFESPPDAFALFRRLCAVSPAPYSAFLRLNDSYVLSSSPELFLAIDADGHARTRPIKGTASRFADSRQDAASRQMLAASEKDKAENLMIADLMRNDFSRFCIAGSVRTESLFDITSHATIHHMSSTVTGRKHPDCSTLNAVKSCFPPGSMTGAPKIAAMRLCSRLESLARGVYSGGIGWFGGDGSCEFSVVIRTLILQGNRFEFQVGGGIVADSTPEGEWRETLAKARGILAALGVSPERIEG